MSIFNSKLAPFIDGLIAQKQSLGYSFSYGVRVLRQFDAFCCERFPEEGTITQKMGLEWTIRLPNENKSISTAKRMSPVRELAKFMLRKGIDAYMIPDEFVSQRSSRYVPHIFSEEELVNVFHEMDRIEKNINPNCYEAYVMPVLFRLIYTCGLRPQEGRLIKRCNMNLQEGVLFIPESKGHKDRYVPLSEDMLNLCQKYDAYIRSKVPDNEFFFPSGKTTCYAAISLEHSLKRYWKRAGLDQGMNGCCPRVYDLRHTFATRKLYQWMREGRNLDACLPFLSTYMGHAHFSQTAYYIHLVPEIFPTLTGVDVNRFSSLLPEVE